MSLLDLFEQEEALKNTLETRILQRELKNAISSRPKIFQLDQVQYPFPSTLEHIAVSNSILVVSMHDWQKEQTLLKLQRIDLEKPDAVDDIFIQSKQKANAIHKLFLDPSARHLIITTTFGDNYYLHSAWKKAKLIPKWKGITIESIGWGMTFPNSTGVLLIGSKQGTIYEDCIHATEDFFKRENRFFKQVYSLDSIKNPGIYGLGFQRFPNQTFRYSVLVSTATSILQFIGNVLESTDGVGLYSFMNLFYSANGNSHAHVQDIPGNLDVSEFHVWYSHGVPLAFAWLTEPGVFYGHFEFGDQQPGESLMRDAQLIPYPSEGIPMSICLTEFHVLLLYKNGLKAISLLTKEITFEENLTFGKDEQVLGLEFDPIKKTYWIFTSLFLYEILANNEDLDVWKIFLAKKQYEKALHFAKDAQQKDVILLEQAKVLYDSKDYTLSASVYSQITNVSFEEIVLKFTSIQQPLQDALKVFLQCKLKRLSPKDITQTVLLCTWMTELYLNQLMQTDGDEQVRITEEFHSFLLQYKTRLDVSTTFKLIQSYSRDQDLVYFAELIQDWGKLLDHWISLGIWSQALDVLSRSNALELYYNSSSILLQNAPSETVDLWMKQSNLNPKYLLSALLMYHENNVHEQNHGIRYLKFVVETLKNSDPLIHNFLLSLYVSQAKYDAEDSLYSFLMSQKDFPHYDVQYALRLCTQNGLTQSCIHLYRQMGMFEAAVDLALKQDDLVLAKIHADGPDEDHLKKKLWLKLCKYLIQVKQNIKGAIHTLRECPLLKLEDILTFFPDFVLIDDFKDEICSALQEYNQDIDELKTELLDVIKSSDSIRMDIRGLTLRSVTFPASQECELCHKSCLTRSFYVFPCRHVFHAECLLSRYKQQESFGLDMDLQSKQDVKSKELVDERMASECFYCGESMIQTIDEPFLTTADADTLV